MQKLCRPPIARLHDDGTITITINRALRSPNASLWKHWRVRHREKCYWRAAILTGLVAGVGGRSLVALLPASSGFPRAAAATPGRRRVTIERYLPRPSHAIRDIDNLVFSTKFVLDALVSLGLIRDDSPRWCERPIPLQIPSADGQAWTVITIATLNGGTP